MDLSSRFFTYEDPQLKQMDDFYVPDEWWSRGYEYQWCSQFLNKKEIILDAACGIEHPFKWYAANRVKKIHAVDADARILELKTFKKNIEFKHIKLIELENNFEPETFDKIFCISVLEHLPRNALDILHQFKRLLKPNGIIVMTIDHPFMLTENFVGIVNIAELQFVSEVDYKIPKNAVKGPYNGLKCYSALLTKDSKNINIGINETPEVKPAETKVLEPKETK